MKSNLNLVQLLNGDYSENNFREIAKYADGVGPSFQSVIKGKDENDNFIITDFVKNAHEQGLLVHPYTFRADAYPVYCESFNELLEIAYFTADFDGIFTDFPDKAIDFLNNR